MEQQRATINHAMDALADVQRRRLLLAVLESNPQDDTPPAADGDPALQRAVSMRHVHLPKLETYGFIEWDRDAHEVTRGPNFEEIRPLLELIDDNAAKLPDGWL